MEANLIHDAKVVLNNIEIKERRLVGGGGSYLSVSGSIEQIEFSWVWDGAALIKDVRLTVRGVSVDAEVIQGDGQDVILSDDVVEDTADSNKDANKDEAPPDWKAKYTQQIIDHLTLAVTDSTINIHLKGSKTVFLQSKGMELLTLTGGSNGEKATNALMQIISLESIEAWIEQDDASNKFPILEPLGYKANVTRVSGRRFFDGVLSGLLVEGKSIDDSSRTPSTIRVHACIQQIVDLSSLQQVLLLFRQEDTTEAPVITEQNNQAEDLSNTLEKKSMFNLPFQSMEVVLENETNLRVEGCSVRYSTDGSELCIECSGGVWMDETPLSKDNRWVLDFVSCEMLLDSIPPHEYGDSFYSAHSDDLQASIPKFDLTLHFTPTLMNINDATLAFDEFQGSTNTTLSQIKKHYRKTQEDLSAPKLEVRESNTVQRSTLARSNVKLAPGNQKKAPSNTHGIGAEEVKESEYSEFFLGPPLLAPLVFPPAHQGSSNSHHSTLQLCGRHMFNANEEDHVSCHPVLSVAFDCNAESLKTRNMQVSNAGFLPRPLPKPKASQSILNYSSHSFDPIDQLIQEDAIAEAAQWDEPLTDDESEFEHDCSGFFLLSPEETYIEKKKDFPLLKMRCK